LVYTFANIGTKISHQIVQFANSPVVQLVAPYWSLMHGWWAECLSVSLKLIDQWTQCLFRHV